MKIIKTLNDYVAIGMCIMLVNYIYITAIFNVNILVPYVIHIFNLHMGRYLTIRQARAFDRGFSHRIHTQDQSFY